MVFGAPHLSHVVSFITQNPHAHTNMNTVITILHQGNKFKGVWMWVSSKQFCV